MKPIQIAVAVAAALFAAACLPVTSKNPVGSTAGFAADPGLYGVWRGHGKDNGTEGYISFLRNEDGTMTAVLVTPPTGTDGGDWEVFNLQVATLGGSHYMTARETYVRGKPVEGDEALQNIPLLYRVEGQKLTLYLIDEKAAASAIRSGKLKGTVGTGQDPDVAITSDAKELDAFFASKESASLFTEPLLTLKKID